MARPLRVPSILIVHPDRKTQRIVQRILGVTGYRVDIAKVPYLAPLLTEIGGADAWPLLDHWMQTPARGLFLPGFTATRDFGPFFGFVRGCPSASRTILKKVMSEE